jgi:PAS domain-containing protein
MILKITENTSAKELQEEFEKRFPYLKIELYSVAHKAGEGSSIKNQLPNNITLGEATGSSLKGIIEVNSLTKVSELEQQFQNIFGISAQVFRNNNSTWIQTTATDSWTLGEQNNHAREIAGEVVSKEEPGDYREQE